MDWTCANCATVNVATESFCVSCGAGAPHSYPDIEGNTGVAAPTTVIPTLPPPPLPPRPGGPGPYGAYGQPPKRRRTGLIVLLCGALALVLIAGVIAAVMLSADDPSEVVLEPVDMVAADSFANNFDVDVDAGKEMSEISDFSDDAPDDRIAQIDASLSGRAAEGTDEGLYGGSRDTQVCDSAGLVAFLTDPANEAEATAWSGVLGVEVDEIEEYVTELTAVRLRWDTRVTNHGFVDGEANAYQSLLQAGTAVLVDDEGVPRVKCNCGNPLLEPEALGDVAESTALDVDHIASNPEAAWSRLDADEVVTITPAEETVDDITILDVDSGGLLDRPVGSDGVSLPDKGTGDLQVTLEWESNADLDLHVQEPDGTEIYHANRGPTSTRGELDVDANVGCPTGVDDGIENVYWPTGEAPSGSYEIEVYGYSVGTSGSSRCGGGDFTLTITVEGEETVETGSVTDGESATYEIEVP